MITQSLKPEDKEKYKSNNEKLAKSRIKLGLLNEIEKNDLSIDDELEMKYKNKLKECLIKKWF